MSLVKKELINALRERDAARAELAQAREVLRGVECSYSGMLYGDEGRTHLV